MACEMLSLSHSSYTYARGDYRGVCFGCEAGCTGFCFAGSYVLYDHGVSGVEGSFHGRKVRLLGGLAGLVG